MRSFVFTMRWPCMRSSNLSRFFHINCIDFLLTYEFFHRRISFYCEKFFAFKRSRFSHINHQLKSILTPILWAKLFDILLLRSLSAVYTQFDLDKDFASQYKLHILIRASHVIIHIFWLLRLIYIEYVSIFIVCRPINSRANTWPFHLKHIISLPVSFLFPLMVKENHCECRSWNCRFL